MSSEEKKTTALVSTVENNKALANMYNDDFVDDYSKEDLLIPRVLLAQAQSQYVADGKAAAGDIVGSLDYNVLAKKGEALEFLTFHRTKSFRLLKKAPGGGTPKFIAEVPYDIDTKEWETRKLREVEWEYTDEDGKKVKENLLCFITWNYYVLPLNNIHGLPQVISFSSTSYTTAKKLGAFILEFRNMNIPMPFHTYKLRTELIKNDKGTFYKYAVEKGQHSTDEQLAPINGWLDLIRKGEVVVDTVEKEDTDSDIGESPKVEKGVVDEDAKF